MIPLDQWYSTWLNDHAKTNLIWASPQEPHLEQVRFMRDYIEPVMRPTGYVLPIYVIGEHRSKSVRLPVFQIERTSVSLVARYNFHCWNVSVTSASELDLDLRGFGSEYYEDEVIKFRSGHRVGSHWGSLFFEGIPSELQYGPYSQNKRCFSLAPSNNYEMYAFVRHLVSRIKETK